MIASTLITIYMYVDAATREQWMRLYERNAVLTVLMRGTPPDPFSAAVQYQY